jgi:1,4-dihydroxy-2-naphthoate octaprenyltransferase
VSAPKVWLEAARPRTLPAAFAPVIVGTAAADRFIFWRAAAALVVAVAIQVGVNLANDLFDGVRGVDTAERVGPRRAVASGLVSPKAMKLAMMIAFGVAGIAGLILALEVGYELLVVGALCFLAALGYSGGSKPYASRGLGEIFVFVFFGLVATAGSQYVQDESLSRVAYVAAIPIGLLASAILVVNNLRDIRTDEASGKRTLAVKLGAPRTRRVFQAVIVVALGYTLVVAGVAGSFLPLLGLAATPLAVRPVLTVLYDEEPGALIGALVGTARLQLVYAILLAVGLWAAS